MSCDYIALASPGIQGLSPYQPGKPIEALQREMGLSEVVKLASNENPLGISPLAKKAVENALSDVSRYPDGSGFRLKSALSDRLGVNSVQITLGNGSNDILDLLARGFADPETEIIYSEFGFAVYPLATQSVGARHVKVPAKNWGHDLPAMASAVTDRTKLIFIANPNNPTGTYVTSDALRAFLDSVPSRVVVVLDEAYCEYIDRPDYPNGLELAKDYENLVISRTFSKAWGLAALRVGYCVSHPDIADILNRVRHPFNVNSLALVAAEAVLEDASYLQEGIRINQEGMTQLMHEFDQRQIEFIPSVGNFICFKSPMDAMDLNDALLRKGVIVRPVANYGMQEHLRVSIGLPSENQQFIKALDACMGV